MPTFSVNFIRPGIPSHPVAQRRVDTEETIEVEVQILNGCFNSTMQISAFGGETKIFIHTTSGHYLNWLVVILRPDTAPEFIKGPEYQEDSKIDDAFDAISRHGECAWWNAALPEIKKI